MRILSPSSQIHQVRLWRICRQAIQYRNGAEREGLDQTEVVIDDLVNSFPQDIRSDQAISIRKHLLRDLHVEIDMLRCLGM